jgi:hypothetical protein
MAMHLYLVEKMVPVAIAIQMNVPESTVLIWAEEDRWKARMEERNKDLREMAEQTLENLRLTDAPEMRIRHVGLAKRVEALIATKLEALENDPDNPRLASILKQLTEALKNAGEVGARAAGTYDTPINEEKKPRGASPVININVGEPRAPVKKIEGESHVINP